MVLAYCELVNIFLLVSIYLSCCLPYAIMVLGILRDGMTGVYLRGVM